MRNLNKEILGKIELNPILLLKYNSEAAAAAAVVAFSPLSIY